MPSLSAALGCIIIIIIINACALMPACVCVSLLAQVLAVDKPRKRLPGLEDLQHPLLGDQPTLKLLPDPSKVRAAAAAAAAAASAAAAAAAAAGCLGSGCALATLRARTRTRACSTKQLWAHPLAVCCALN